MAQITILNLNMLYVRYHDTVEQERHLALGPLYVTSALEEAGFEVDFRDYQMHDAEEIFSADEVARFLQDSAPVVGFSCMANLLPFTLLAMRRFKELYPEKTLILAGVGPKSVESKILQRCPWVDLIVRGEAERSAPILLDVLTRHHQSWGAGGGGHAVPLKELSSPARNAAPWAPKELSSPARNAAPWAPEHRAPQNRAPEHTARQKTRVRAFEAALQEVPGISYRIWSDPQEPATIRHTPRPKRIVNLDGITPPAYHQVNLPDYTGFNVITSRGCPYECTFCSVAPVWDHKSYYRSAESVVQDMQILHEKGGAELILFQDEFFVSSPSRVLRFCDTLKRRGLSLLWKAFGRINLSSREMMEAMEKTGCVEIRFGIESGSDRILEMIQKGFFAAETLDVVRTACDIFRRVDLFYVWGYPFESMEEFYETVFQMVSFRMMGARILPSLLCLLPQTSLFKQHVTIDELEFAPDVFPEYMVTGHEISSGAHVEIAPQHRAVFDFVEANPDIFPGFFHVDVAGNIRPKLRVLQEFGFYPATVEELEGMESCGAHSPRVETDAASAETDAASAETDAASVETDAASVETDAASVETDAASNVSEIDRNESQKELATRADAP